MLMRYAAMFAPAEPGTCSISEDQTAGESRADFAYSGSSRIRLGIGWAGHSIPLLEFSS